MKTDLGLIISVIYIQLEERHCTAMLVFDFSGEIVNQYALVSIKLGGIIVFAGFIAGTISAK